MKDNVDRLGQAPEDERAKHLRSRLDGIKDESRRAQIGEVQREFPEIVHDAYTLVTILGGSPYRIGSMESHPIVREIRAKYGVQLWAHGGGPEAHQENVSETTALFCDVADLVMEERQAARVRIRIPQPPQVL